MNEYAFVYARGTGLNNHDASIIKVDENVILNHAYFKGLYLVVLDRKTLATKFKKAYNLLDQPAKEMLVGGSKRFYKQEFILKK